MENTEPFSAFFNQPAVKASREHVAPAEPIEIHAKAKKASPKKTEATVEQPPLEPENPLLA